MRRAARLSRCLWHGFDRAQLLLDRVRTLPAACPADLLQGGPTLVLAPHPDDESLGCGGLIAQAASSGAEVHILIVTDGAGLDHDEAVRLSLSRRRRWETLAASSVLGLPPSHVRFWTLPDGSAPRVGWKAHVVANQVAALARKLAARTILATWDFDDHPDHVAVLGYGRRAARLTGAALFAYPVWAWMLPSRLLVPRLRPCGCTIDIRQMLDIKRRAIFQHASQIAALRPVGASGFALNDEQLARMITPYEAYIACNAAARYRMATSLEKTVVACHL